MARINWHESGEFFYTAGADRGVLYPSVGPGVPWSGLKEVDENEDEFALNTTYIDGQKIETQVISGFFSAKLSAFSYPLEFQEYDGYEELAYSRISGQRRKMFNLSYRTLLANELVGTDLGYQIHLVYNATAAPTALSRSTIDTQALPEDFTWDISTIPTMVKGRRPTSHIIINSTWAHPEVIAEIEDILYGSLLNDPRFPSPDELADIFEKYAVFIVTDNGDGTATVSGPDDAVFMVDADTAQLSYVSVIQLDDETYELSSF